MTKKNVFALVDNLFWLLIALFPLFAYLISLVNAESVVSFGTYLTNLGFGISTDSLIYTTLYQIFGVGGGFLELVNDTGIMLYATYFVTIMLLHFIIDILLVVVRWGHILVDKATKE